MRLITRSDFDGLACGALLEEIGLVHEWFFVHPKDIQDGLVEVTKSDILANVPYAKGCGLWFDHHSSEEERLGKNIQCKGVSKKAPSCARLIYEFYGGEKKLGKFAELVKYADKMDSADLSIEEIKHPYGWVLLGFIVDPRTGLGRVHNFTISNLDVMKKLAQSMLDKRIEEILEQDYIQERIKVYFEQHDLFMEMIKKHAVIKGDAIFVDMRGVETIYAGNRFLLYTLFPEQNISVWVVNDKAKAKSVISVGYSIINKTATVDVGSLMLKYGGGGHSVVGSCQVPAKDADRIINEVITAVAGPQSEEIAANSLTLSESAGPVEMAVDLRFLSSNYNITCGLFKKPSWLPELVCNDGQRTYIRLPASVPQGKFPAVFENQSDKINAHAVGNIIIIYKPVEDITLKLDNQEVRIQKKKDIK